MSPALIDAYQQRLGLKPSQLSAWLNLAPDRPLWRVAAVERGRYRLLAPSAAGTLVETQAEPGAVPLAVGDWVILEAGRERVAEVLPRLSVLRRGSAHHEGSEQLIAANLDTVFVVAAFAETEKLEKRSLRARRLERFISAVVEGGARPVVVLNKADLPEHAVEAMEASARALSTRLAGTPVVLTSAHADAGLTALEAHIAPGDTVAFIGPSGVGKSSLINRLAGEERQTVRDVRERDMKGRHTTTRRELIPITHGALLIDTPGVREFAVLADDGVAGFTDIDQLAEHCKFPDCQHAAEPECAVRAAIERGELPEDRLASYLSIASDAERLAAKHDPYSRHLEKQEGKRFGRLVRSVTRLKGATAAPRLKSR